MKLKKINKLKSGLLLRHIPTNVYCISQFNRDYNKVVVYSFNSHCIKIPNVLEYEILGALKDFKRVNDEYIIDDPKDVKVNDIYEVLGKNDKIVDVILISAIKNDVYHLIHKDGSVELCSKEQIVIYNFDISKKKILNIHYQLTC